MLPSAPHELALAALTALGTNLVVMRGRAARMNADINMDLETVSRKPRRRSRAIARKRSSTSSRSTTRTTRTISSHSSSKSLTKSTRSKAKSKPKAKSTTSKTSDPKASSLTKVAGRRRTVVTVAKHPKAEKYVPPPRGTFRSSYTRFLRAEVLGGVISELEGLTMPKSLPLVVESAGSAEQHDASPSTHPEHLIKRPPLATLTAPTPTITLEDLPALALAEFDFFSASRAQSAANRDTSEVWSRSPAAPAPPSVRRWLKNARASPVGTVEVVEEQEPRDSGVGKKKRREPTRSEVI